MMKAFAVLAICAIATGSAVAKGGSHGASTTHSSHTATHSSSSDTHSVSGHVTKNGTYVAPHRQTNPNDTKHDNWSTKGNVNPDTGKAGSKDPNK